MTCRRWALGLLERTMGEGRGVDRGAQNCGGWEGGNGGKIGAMAGNNFQKMCIGDVRIHRAVSAT